MIVFNHCSRPATVSSSDTGQPVTLNPLNIDWAVFSRAEYFSRMPNEHFSFETIIIEDIRH